MTCVVLLTVAAAAAQSPKGDPAGALPALWFGKWVGTLVITREGADPQEVPMTLEIRPLADGARYTWRLHYAAAAKKQDRDYELITKPGKSGRFEIDEKNGIRLEARLVGGALYSQFQVGEAVIHSRYERVGEVLKVEMTAYTTRDALTTKPTAGGADVRSLTLLSVQVAELKRVAEGK
jgi:hypothetical protein